MSRHSTPGDRDRHARRFDHRGRSSSPGRLSPGRRPGDSVRRDRPSDPGPYPVQGHPTCQLCGRGPGRTVPDCAAPAALPTVRSPGRAITSDYCDGPRAGRAITTGTGRARRGAGPIRDRAPHALSARDLTDRDHIVRT
eukprot:227377-Hanusia_phi.AAC.1